jgi:2-polyprenyl-3-methyl-5-hydroxy-6-metoxy-1,4-benzoquinol methylase
MLITDRYRAMNTELHQVRKTYGSSGHKWAKWVSGLDDILDYGCGKGTLGRALGREIAEYDPCIPGKDADPDPHDYVVVGDVLEHIEPELLDNVFQHIKEKMLKGGFFVIATRAAKKTLPDGRNAHLIIEPWGWWRERIDKHFKIDSFELNPTEDGEVAVWVSL